MTETEFFETLHNRAVGDTAVIASLRRSAAYDPGLFPAAYPYVEPFVQHMSEWRRSATYLVAAYWAQAQRMGRQDSDRNPKEALTLPKALRMLQAKSDASKTIEARFKALLDADTDELPWRLRHLTSQLAAAGVAIDWPDLLKDLRSWPDPQRRVQIRWAREYWAAREGSHQDDNKGKRTKKPSEASNVA
jgi:CRISPR system Cascade subunit CasB